MTLNYPHPNKWDNIYHLRSQLPSMLGTLCLFSTKTPEAETSKGTEQEQGTSKALKHRENVGVDRETALTALKNQVMRFGCGKQIKER